MIASLQLGNSFLRIVEDVLMIGDLAHQWHRPPAARPTATIQTIRQ